jgi:hypothetical protein
MSQALPFSPLGAALTLSAPNGSSSASTTLPGAGGDTCKVTNENTVPSTVAFSTVVGGAVAASTSLLVNTGLTEIFSIPIGTTDVAVYGVGAVGNVVLQRGSGM